jgi:topoisomerase IA-like protein
LRSKRDALAQSVNRAKEVYQKDGIYGPEVRKNLQEVIEQNKQTFPELFEKK